MCFPCAMPVRRPGQVKIAAKCCAVIVASAALLHATSSHAANEIFGYVSATGSGSTCSASQPCTSYFFALADFDRVRCFNPLADVDNISIFGANATKELDCPGGIFSASSGFVAFALTGPNQTLKIRNMTFSGASGGTKAFLSSGSGTVIFENCVFEGFSGIALDIEPNGALNLVITNSRISNSGSGVLLKPAAGGSVTATFNGVTIADNSGGGVKTDTTNGIVSVDISNSTISNNGGNGMNAVSGAGGTNMLNIKNSIIARNGSAGVQANGASAAALIDMTLLDSNTAGATSAVAGGRLLTYGNNHIVGSAGSGFTGTAPSQ